MRLSEAIKCWRTIVVTFMSKVIFHAHTTYGSTSGKWKECVRLHSLFLDRSTGKITRRPVAEFHDARSGSSVITSDETIKIERRKPDESAASKLERVE